MHSKKTLQELTLKSNFMFAAVMMEPENCRLLLERVLDMEIDHVVVDREKSLIYNPECKGVRLDVFAKNGQNTHYDVEMQIYHEHLEKRARYYHSQMDLEMLLSGEEYEKLPDAFVIFLCDFDPFGLKKYRYRVRKCFEESMQHEYNDGSHTVFLSTKGENHSEISKSLRKFLEFLDAKLQDSEKDFEDVFVAKLQRDIRSIKSSREMGGRYMLFEELLRDEREEGRIEGRLLTLIDLICMKLRDGETAADISGELKTDLEWVESVCKVAMDVSPQYDAEQIYVALYGEKDKD